MFVADDTSHGQANKIYEMLDKLFDHMRVGGDSIEDQLALC